MIIECKKIAKYKNKLIDRKYSRIGIVTVEDILNGKRITIPATLQIAVVRSAELKTKDKGRVKLDLEFG